MHHFWCFRKPIKARRWRLRRRDGFGGSALDVCRRSLMHSTSMAVEAEPADTRARCVRSDGPDFTSYRNEKTGLRRLFPPRTRWSSHTDIAD